MLNGKSPERERVAKETSTNHHRWIVLQLRREPVRKEKSIGRNDPCPCGSGKKYKNCCGREV